MIGMPQTPARPLAPRPWLAAWWKWLLAAACLMAVAAGIELAMGRTPLCTSGTIRLWIGDLHSAELSQQILDWYSFSHVLHGILLYGLLYLAWRRRGSLRLRFLLVVALECGWEILENSPLIIARYRAATIAQGYVGDSILNSMSDVLCCAVGFVLARVLPVWATVVLVVVVEIGLLWAIRDNLTLNILMLVWPVQAIRHWQMGAGLLVAG